MNFLVSFIDLTKRCNTSVSYLVVVNGTLGLIVNPSKGLRLGVCNIHRFCVCVCGTTCLYLYLFDCVCLEDHCPRVTKICNLNIRFDL